jgi:6-phosphogluconate dehydrogenase
VGTEVVTLGLEQVGGQVLGAVAVVEAEGSGGSVFLKDITNAYRNNPDLENLLFDDFFKKAINNAVVEAEGSGEGRSGDTPQSGLADHVTPAVLGVVNGTSVPTLSASSPRTLTRPSPRARISTLTGPAVVVTQIHTQKKKTSDFVTDHGHSMKTSKYIEHPNFLPFHTFRIKPENANETFPEGKDIHVNWTGRGGDVSASTRGRSR